MKELTAEKVLENTFNHLEEMLDKEQKTEAGRQPCPGGSSQPDREAGGDRENLQESAVERK